MDLERNRELILQGLDLMIMDTNDAIPASTGSMIDYTKKKLLDLEVLKKNVIDKVYNKQIISESINFKSVNSITEINNYVNAFRMLFNREPIVSIKGELSTSWEVNYSDFQDKFIKIRSIGKRYIYLDVNDFEIKNVPYYFYDNECCFILLE